MNHAYLIVSYFHVDGVSAYGNLTIYRDRPIDDKTLSDVKETVAEYYTVDNGVQGVTILNIIPLPI